MLLEHRFGRPAIPRPWRSRSLCAICHGWGEQRVCGECVARFAPTVPRCRRCGLDVPPGVSDCGACRVESPPFERTLAAVVYGHPWNGLITNFKFRAALDLAPVLAQLILTAQRRGDVDVPALLVPVPLSAVRLRERGYNQAWELARRLAPALSCDADATLLLRVRDTPHQLTLEPAQRAANVRGVFALEPRRLAEVRGRDVGVVDDVMTTGATAAEAARVLLRAGAARVSLWVVARTPRPADR